MNISYYLREQIAGHTLGGTTLASSNAYVGLLSSLDGAEYTELSGTGYSRIAAAFDAPVNGTTRNSADIVWSAAGSDWGTARYVGIFDASVSGNLLYWGQLRVAKSISTSAIFKILKDKLSLAMTGAFSQYLGNSLINLTLRDTDFTVGSSLYAGLGYLSSGTLLEPTGNGYARLAIEGFVSGGTGIRTIGSPQLDFLAAGGDWGTMTHIGIYDQLTGGNLLYMLELTPSRPIYDADGMTFEVNDVTVRIR